MAGEERAGRDREEMGAGQRGQKYVMRISEEEPIIESE